MFGCDFAYGSGITVAQLKNAGVKFVCRYLAPLPNGKVINAAEAHNYMDGGVGLVLNWEWTGRDVDRGSAGGHDDARVAADQADKLGLGKAVIYFSPADFDAGPGDMARLNAYFDGCATVLARNRIGGYLDIEVLRPILASGKIQWAWQPYAWAGGQVMTDTAHIYQYQNGVHMGPATVDYDRSLKADFGQNPRPGLVGLPEPVGPYRHTVKVGDHYTYPGLAKSRGTTRKAITELSRKHLGPQRKEAFNDFIALDAALETLKQPHPVMPAGLSYYTAHP